MKWLLKITSESKWNDYKAVVLASLVQSLDLVITKEYGLGGKNIEASPLFDICLENNPTLQPRPNNKENKGDH
jgi:hypothetical protein